MLNMMETMEVKSLRMCEERRRKTRRGKKRRNGVSLENTESSGNFDDFTTSYVNYHPYLHSSIPEVKRGSRHSSKFFRPRSPNAPQNSTQFLIEDHGHIEQFDTERTSACCSSSSSPDMSPGNQTEFPFHTLDATDNVDYNGISMYDDNSDVKPNGVEDSCYTPVCQEETLNFICQEFEREYQLNEDVENETKRQTKHQDLMAESKRTIIQKILDIEAKLQLLES